MIDRARIAEIIGPEHVRSPFLVEGEAHAANVRVHSKGQYSEALMEIVRPNEEDQYKAYRKDVFKSVTKKAFSRVLTTLAKIRLAEDWRITWPVDADKGFPEGESLKDYTTENYPGFDSLENWFWSLGLKTMCEDPNAVVAVFPLRSTELDTEYYEPFTNIFATKDVVHFVEGKLVVVRDRLPGSIRPDGGTVQGTTVYHVLDRDEYQVWEVVQEENQIRSFVTVEIRHDMGYLPVIQLGGVVEQFEGGQMLWHSWLDPCLDDWDEAVRRYSDHQVNMVLHLHPDRWEVSDQECRAPGCERGKVQENVLRNGVQVLVPRPCGNCNGTGRVSVRTPFGVKQVRPFVQQSASESVTIPTPPMGNVPRDIGSLTYLKEEYKDKIRQGLDALNMGFLDREPGINSGYAKALDREEMNTFFNAVANHIVNNILRPCYFFVNEWRNRRVVGDAAARKGLEPVISIPTKFDLIFAQLSAERAKFAREAGFSSTITAELELQYAVREFGEGSPQVALIQAVLKLDPLPHKTVDEKLAIVSSRGTSMVNYVISSNLHSFLAAAIRDDENFLKLDYAKQMERLRELAEAMIKENTAGLVATTYEPETTRVTGGAGPGDGNGAGSF